MDRLLGYSSRPTTSVPSVPVVASDAKSDKQAIREIRRDAREARAALKGAGTRARTPEMTVSPLGSYLTASSLSNAVHDILVRLDSFLTRLFAPATPPVAPPPEPKPPKDEPPASTPSQGDTDFVVSSFNILGSSHTAPGGINAHYASGVERTRWAAQLLRDKKIDVVGFQEMNPDQARELKRVAGKEYALFPGAIKRHLGSHNSIAWRKDTWDLVSAKILDMPSHRGRNQPTPLVRLRNKETGQEVYFLNVHNAPGYHKNNAQQNWRDAATQKQIALLNDLKKSGIPVIMTGDMNEKERAFTKMTRDAGMKAANSPNGRMPKLMTLDWIFGSKSVDFSRFTRLTKGVVGRITDHGVLMSKVHIDD